MNYDELVFRCCLLFGNGVTPEHLYSEIQKSIEERKFTSKAMSALKAEATEKHLAQAGIITDMEHLLRMRTAGVFQQMTEVDYLQQMEQVLAGKKIDQVMNDYLSAHAGAA